MPHTFGIEIELLAPSHLTQVVLADRITAEANVLCQAAGYTHRQTGIWKVVSDGSISIEAGMTGHEVVSPILTAERFDEIDRVCAVLSRLRCKVNRTCGLHVHIGAATLSVDAQKALALLYADHEDIIDSLLPPSRRGSRNNYCRPLKDKDMQAVRAATSATDISRALSGTARNADYRYGKLNYAAMWRHNTVEFRHHSGTIDPAKIKAWAKFCAAMVDTAAREAAVTPVSTVTTAFDRNYWTAGPRRRTMYALLSRPEGATGDEVRAALNVTQAPSLKWHIEKAGLDSRQARQGRRGGQPVFRITAEMMIAAEARTNALQLVPATPASNTGLEPFLDRLQVEPNERTFWVERQTMLSGMD